MARSVMYLFKEKRFFRYLLAMLLPLAVLLARPIIPAAVLLFGQEIRLSTVPVDPRDIFRGDYVTLRFSIEEVDESILSERDEWALFARLGRQDAAPTGAPPLHLYVALEPDGEGIWQPVGMSLTPPKEGVYLRAAASRGPSTTIKLNYGDYLRRYYVKENTGLELEDAARRGKLTAIVKVWRGRAVLTSVEKSI